MPETGAMVTVGRALDEAADRLGRAGIARPRRESAALLAALQGLNAGALWLQRELPLESHTAQRLWHAVEQRSHGVPFAYAVGRATFRHLDLKCDSRALIPRPETEGLVQLVLDWLRGVHPASGDARRSRGVVADIGTGSGCTALALATEAPESIDRVIAVERSPEAAALARENARLVQPTVPVDVREGSLFEPIAGLRCRVVVSNPPYLTTEEHGELDVSVRCFEPREALAAGTDGLAVITTLLSGALTIIEPAGLLAVEIDERRAERVEALAHAHGWCSVRIHEDLFGQPRYLVATAPREGGNE